MGLHLEESNSSHPANENYYPDDEITIESFFGTSIPGFNDTHWEQADRLINNMVRGQVRLEDRDDTSAEIVFRIVQGISRDQFIAPEEEPFLNFLAWVSQVARNTIKNHYRRNGNAGISGLEIYEEVLEDPLDIEQEIILGETLDETITAINQLLPNQKMVMVLLMENCDLLNNGILESIRIGLAEVGIFLEIGGIKSRIHRARVELRKTTTDRN